MTQDAQWQVEAFDVLINNSNSLIICLSSDAVVITFNQQAEKILGWQAKNVLNKNFFKLCAKANIKPPLEDYSAVSPKKITQTQTTTVLHCHGEETVLQWNIFPINDAKYDFQILIIGNKITPQNLAEKKAIIINSYLSSIINNLPHYIFWKDTNSIFLGCNQKFADSVGLKSPHDIIGKTDYDMPWKKEQSTAYIKDDQRIIKTGMGKLNYEEHQRQTEGSEIVVLVSKVPMYDEEGQITGVLGIYTDISERKKAEQELKEAKEHAETANNAKSEFLAVVSHELRIPLTGILGTAQLLSTENLQTEHKSQVADIIKSGDYLLSVVTDILDYAKVEAGKFELNLAPLDFRKLLEETATMLASKVKEKNLELLISYADNTPLMVISDARSLRHILLNLVGNAIKFTAKGHIWIKVKCLKKSKQEATLILSVQDSGIGIAAEKQAIIFDRFSQADSSTTRQYGGTGLGLAITKAYVEELGGTISVESKPKKGATFSCTIPFQLPIASKSQSPWELYKSRVKVLVVDDTLHGEVLCRHVASSLCELTAGIDALNTLRAAQQRKEPFDIVIINQQLHKTTALQLAKAIQQQSSLHQPMLLLVMQKNSLRQQTSAKKVGYFGFLTRPTHPTELLINLTAAWEKWLDEKYKNLVSIIIPKKQDKPTTRILLVEDEPIVQTVHLSMLKKLGYHVDLAKNGSEALKMAAKNYQLIFMDIGLPDIQGTDIAKKIRAREKKRKTNKRIPIIGLTGYGGEEHRNKCIAAGMDDTAVKPVKLEELQRLLNVWVK